ncbi:Basic helix-loop-helix DNA-binding superfamily protein putative isoform 1 [Tripterygium wilfordii]|uniref:Basic helix-loop-helix DNA-binding superfamily protein putative isoform 1 n=1 Tax=Tripterygium wilfordii TaxID=458696 RepID=A0A7J7CV91_TRIWF|nr:uncharacterized protein At4g38062-like [Tripterygium wilfordii]XP_038719361.1 uncharacterized protein At4g38062-like [Tripterygium wilfordii]KAF5738032.1 Basic helix-loop-helix DNA-binding superfamily protein putative isoform 1 [Tripterygium wilfordii]
MERVCEELDEAKAEIENLRVDLKSKLELSNSLKKVHNEQIIKIQELSSKNVKQNEELNEKAEEISELKQMNDNLKCRLNERESITKCLNAANDKLRAEYDEKYRKWEEENRGLLVALDEANEKNVDQEQKINVFMAEIEGLKGLLSFSEKKYLEAEKKAQSSKELRARDDALVKLEEENQELEDQLKWKKEQFQHLEEAHKKLRDQFRTSKKEWEQERLTLVDKISSLQSSLDSQTRISEDLQRRLKMCNQALAHEESRRKYLEIELSEFKTRFECVFTECQDAKSQLEFLTTQREREIAALRHSLDIKETFHKEMEYRAGKLEQEKLELLESLRELQEAGIHEAGNSSSVGKLQTRLKKLEKMHRGCSDKLRAKEAEWSSQLDKTFAERDLMQKDLEEQVLLMESNFKEKLREVTGTLDMANSELAEERKKTVCLLARVKSLEEHAMEMESDSKMKLIEVSDALNMENSELAEEHKKTACLLTRVKSLEDHALEMESDSRMKLIEVSDALNMENSELAEECEKTACLLTRVKSLEEHALEMESDSKMKLVEVSDALNMANSELPEEREKTACLLTRVKSLEEHALEMESDSKMTLVEVSDALNMANSELAEERKKTACLLNRVKSLEEHALEMESDSKMKLIEVSDALNMANSELAKECKKTACLLNRVKSLEEHALEMESDSKMKLTEVSDALNMANSELTEECGKTSSLLRRVESLELIEDQLCLMQKQLESYREMLEESSRYKLQLEEQVLQMEIDSNEKLGEVNDALDKANSELDERICAAHEIEFQLWIWRSIAQRLKDDLEHNQELRKELEASLLAQVVDGETNKKERECLIHMLKEKGSEIDNLQQRIALLEQKIEKEQLEANDSAPVKKTMSLVSEKESFLQEMRDKDKILEALQKEIGLLEQESLRRELEGMVIAQITAERRFEDETGNLILLVEGKQKKIDGLLQLVKSLERKFKNSLISFSSQLAEKQMEIDMVHEAWEKTTAAEILAQLEIEEKKLMIVELEDDICHVQQKLELQENLSSHSKQQALHIEAEAKAKETEIKILANQMESKLKESDALINKLREEKQKLHEDVMELLSERENLLHFIEGLEDRISKLSIEDMKLMGMLGRMSDVVPQGDYRLFDTVKENVTSHPSSPMKKFEVIPEGRSPFRELNYSYNR